MKRTVLILLVVLLVGYLLTGLTVVRPGERAVIRRFGRVLPDKPGPGLHIGLPWGMDRVDRIPMDQVRRVRVGYEPSADMSDIGTPDGQLLTGDQNLVNVQVVLFYSVERDAEGDRLDEYLVEREGVDDLVSRAAESALAEWAASHTVDHILLYGKSEIPPWLVEAARRRLAPYRLGIHIHDQASVAYLYPPEQVRHAFDRVTQAETGIRKQIYEAEQKAEQIVRLAESEQHRKRQLARAYATEQELMAHADASNFDRRRRQYHELRRTNPSILTGIWWEEMGKLFADLNKAGRLDLLDHHLGADGIDILQFPPQTPRR